MSLDRFSPHEFIASLGKKAWKEQVGEPWTLVGWGGVGPGKGIIENSSGHEN